MNLDPIAADWKMDAPLQLLLPLRFDDGMPRTEQDHPEQFEPQPTELQ